MQSPQLLHFICGLQVNSSQNFLSIIALRPHFISSHVLLLSPSIHSPQSSHLYSEKHSALFTKETESLSFLLFATELAASTLNKKTNINTNAAANNKNFPLFML